MKLSSSTVLAVLATFVPSVVAQCAGVSETLEVLYVEQGGTLTFDFGTLPPAGGPVTITGSFEGDLNGPVENAVVGALNGNQLFAVGNTPIANPNGNCQLDTTTVLVGALQFNGLMALTGGDVVLQMNVAPNVDAPDPAEDVADPWVAEGHINCPGSKGTITISYLPAICEPNALCPPVATNVQVAYTEQGGTLDFDFGPLPPALSGVIVIGTFFGDINGPFEYAITTDLNGNPMFPLLDGNPTGSCRLATDFTLLAPGVFNDIISASPVVDFHMDVTPNVDGPDPIQDSLTDPWVEEGWINCPGSTGTIGVYYIPTECGGGTGGDPHFKTWKNEHFEFHGQCDVVLTSVKNFGQLGIDLDIHIRTSMVRYWSYIKTAVIRIGNDILEVKGSADKEDGEAKRHYWLNYEYLAPLSELSGFPVTISPRNNMYNIDTSSVVPGSAIQIKTFKEFVSVKFVRASEKAFGKAIGILGDYKTGKTFGRDGVTEIDDYNDLGLEWQVLPSDDRLFREPAHPQFPELCLLPEDPRGERRRRLEGSGISMEDAEAACGELKDPLDRKDCVYDILATQDLDMVGAF